MTEEKKQSHLTKAGRFLIGKYQIDGIGIGVCGAVLLMNFVDNRSTLVYVVGISMLLIIIYGVIKKTKYLDTLVEPEEAEQ